MVLLAVVPEALRARWIRVVPAHAGSGSSACPRGGRSGSDKADGRAGSDGSAPGPIVPTGPSPAYAAAGITRTHHGAPAHHGAACDPTARADNRSSAHGASAPHDNFGD